MACSANFEPGHDTQKILLSHVRNRACFVCPLLPWSFRTFLFLDLGWSHGQIVPELIMAENNNPLRLTGFFTGKKWGNFETKKEGKKERKKEKRCLKLSFCFGIFSKYVFFSYRACHLPKNELLQIEINSELSAKKVLVKNN